MSSTSPSVDHVKVVVLVNEKIFHEHEISLIKGFNYGQEPLELLKGIISLFHLSVAKGYGYGDSWKRRGEIRGIMANIDRKYDRLGNAINQQQLGKPSDTNAKLEGAADLSVYSMLYVFDFLRVTYPVEFEKWLTGGDVGGFIENYEKIASGLKEGKSST